MEDIGPTLRVASSFNVMVNPLRCPLNLDIVNQPTTLPNPQDKKGNDHGRQSTLDPPPRRLDLG